MAKRLVYMGKWKKAIKYYFAYPYYKIDNIDKLNQPIDISL